MQVSLSSEVMQMVKMVPRGFTATADAYLTPHIMRSASRLSSPNAWLFMMWSRIHVPVNPLQVSRPFSGQLWLCTDLDLAFSPIHLTEIRV